MSTHSIPGICLIKADLCLVDFRHSAIGIARSHTEHIQNARASSSHMFTRLVLTVENPKLKTEYSLRIQPIVLRKPSLNLAPYLRCVFQHTASVEFDWRVFC
jgi:hypothetical protein